MDVKYEKTFNANLFMRDLFTFLEPFLENGAYSATVQRCQVEVRRCKKIGRVGGEYSTEMNTVII